MDARFRCLRCELTTTHGSGICKVCRRKHKIPLARGFKGRKKNKKQTKLIGNNNVFIE